MYIYIIFTYPSITHILRPYFLRSTSSELQISFMFYLENKHVQIYKCTIGNWDTSYFGLYFCKYIRSNIFKCAYLMWNSTANEIVKLHIFNNRVRIYIAEICTYWISKRGCNQNVHKDGNFTHGQQGYTSHAFLKATESVYASEQHTQWTFPRFSVQSQTVKTVSTVLTVILTVLPSSILNRWRTVRCPL